VYDELRKLAAARMAREPSGHSLDATALTHEAYLRLVGDQTFDGRAHFFGAAAEAMRRILVDHARAKRAQKRGSGARSDLDPNGLPASELDTDRWIDVDEALARFAEIDATAAELAKLRIFGGLLVAEAGDALGLPRASAFRTWAYARAWLTARLADEARDS
jgi:RNA polymerase sigma factor (TIGR02999 family)